MLYPTWSIFEDKGSPLSHLCSTTRVNVYAPSSSHPESIQVQVLTGPYPMRARARKIDEVGSLARCVSVRVREFE